MFNNKKKIIKKLQEIVKFDSFLKSILSSINFSLESDKRKIKVSKDNLNIKTNINEINVQIKNNEVIFTKKEKNKIITEEYIETKNNYLIKQKEDEIIKYNLDDRYSINKNHSEKIRVYDKDKLEVFRRESEKKDNYYQDKKNGEIMLHEPDVMENYTEDRYYYRLEKKYIIVREIKKYIYPEGTQAFIPLRNQNNCLLRYESVDPKETDIPFNGNYYGIDNQVFFDYKQDKATIDDIKDNFKSKKYYISHRINF